MKKLHMKVYMKGRKDPLFIETNVEWALPYWTKRRDLNPNIYWMIG